LQRKTLKDDEYLNVFNNRDKAGRAKATNRQNAAERCLAVFCSKDYP